MGTLWESGGAVNGSVLKAAIYFPRQPGPWLGSWSLSAEAAWEMGEKMEESFLL